MTILYILAAILILLLAVLLIRTTGLSKKSGSVSSIEKPAIDQEEVSRHLSQLIQFKSVSIEGLSNVDPKPFLDIHAWIEKTYPLLSSNLKKTTINESSLLYTWPGKDPKLSPVLFNAHLDVVPVEENTLPSWKVEPFSGTIKNGFIWGRGALDMKCQVIGLLDAIERLLKAGFTPKRTIYLAFGHDEEVMGFQGSKKIVEYLRKQGINLAAMLDEGGFVSKGLLPGIETPFALIGIAEKGYLTLKLTATGNPGHSSQPPRQTAIGVISRAIALLDDNPLPARLDFFLPTMQKIGFLLPFGMRIAIANTWLFKRLLIKSLQQSPPMNAMIRTTHAATMINGGVKDNVLPSMATAKVNLRLLPGDSVESAIAYIKKVVNDPRVEIKIDEDNGGWDASQISPVNTPAYLSLELVARQIFDNVSVAPFVFLAATDSRHYQPICKNTFKFSPFVLTAEDQSGIHGVNERISQKNLTDIVAFYMRIMRVWGDAEF